MKMGLSFGMKLRMSDAGFKAKLAYSRSRKKLEKGVSYGGTGKRKNGHNRTKSPTTKLIEIWKVRLQLNYTGSNGALDSRLTKAFKKSQVESIFQGKNSRGKDDEVGLGKGLCQGGSERNQNGGFYTATKRHARKKRSSKERKEVEAMGLSTGHALQCNS